MKEYFWKVNVVDLNGEKYIAVDIPSDFFEKWGLTEGELVKATFQENGDVLLSKTMVVIPDETETQL